MYHDDDTLADGMADDVLNEDTLDETMDGSDILDDSEEGIYDDENSEPEYE